MKLIQHKKYKNIKNEKERNDVIKEEMLTSIFFTNKYQRYLQPVYELQPLQKMPRRLYLS